jgi:sugar lactone lactonase YvrE
LFLPDFSTPLPTIGVALDANENLLVADGGNNRILMFANDGSTTANRVYGQRGSFTLVIGNNGVSASSFYSPLGIAVDASGGFYVADQTNERVLYFAYNEGYASRVYGQGGNFASAICDSGGVNGNTLCNPVGVALDPSDNLYVVDGSNHRVLVYPSKSTTATIVYGQPGLGFNGANIGGLSASSLYGPWAVTLDRSCNVFIVDSGNHRVLFYAGQSTVASRVYGQLGSFTSNAPNINGVTADSLHLPLSVAVDSKDQVFILDSGNSRVLCFKSGSIIATRVYGQLGSFTTSIGNINGVSADSLNIQMVGITIDRNTDNLLICDSANNRIMVYSGNSTTASAVYGQTSFTNAGAQSSDQGFSYPVNAAVDQQGNLYAADGYNQRVIFLPKAKFPATKVWGQMEQV